LVYITYGRHFLNITHGGKQKFSQFQVFLTLNGTHLLKLDVIPKPIMDWPFLSTVRAGWGKQRLLTRLFVALLRKKKFQQIGFCFSRLTIRLSNNYRKGIKEFYLRRYSRNGHKSLVPRCGHHQHTLLLS